MLGEASLAVLIISDSRSASSVTLNLPLVPEGYRGVHPVVPCYLLSQSLEAVGIHSMKSEHHL